MLLLYTFLQAYKTFSVFCQTRYKNMIGGLAGMGIKHHPYHLTTPFCQLNTSPNLYFNTSFLTLENLTEIPQFQERKNDYIFENRVTSLVKYCLQGKKKQTEYLLKVESYDEEKPSEVLVSDIETYGDKAVNPLLLSTDFSISNKIARPQHIPFESGRIQLEEYILLAHETRGHILSIFRKRCRWG